MPTISGIRPTDGGLFKATDVWGEDGEPTHHALVEIIAFLKARLDPSSGPD